MSETNPYASPTAALAEPAPRAPGAFVSGGKSAPAGSGFNWMMDGFRVFFRAPWPWFGAVVAYFIAAIIASIIPLVGPLVSALAYPLCAAGFFAAGDVQARTGRLDIGDFFVGFRERTGQLIGVGAIVFAGSLLAAIVGVLVGGGRMMMDLFLHRGNSALGLGAFQREFLLGLLTYLALVIPVMMASWFAPALVVLANLSPIEALKQSFAACLKNFLPFFVYSIVSFIAIILACLPVGLGLLVVIPAMVASLYPQYTAIFLDSSQ